MLKPAGVDEKPQYLGYDSLSAEARMAYHIGYDRGTSDTLDDNQQNRPLSKDGTPASTARSQPITDQVNDEHQPDESRLQSMKDAPPQNAYLAGFYDGCDKERSRQASTSAVAVEQGVAGKEMAEAIRLSHFDAFPIACEAYHEEVKKGLKLAKGCKAYMAVVLEKLSPYLHPTTQPTGSDAAGAVDDDFSYLKKAVAEQQEEKSGYWYSCTGCFEGGEYGGNEQYYPYSKVFQCRPGSGCHECGGIGVVWDDTDYEEHAKFLAKEDAKTMQQPTRHESTSAEVASKAGRVLADAPKLINDLSQDDAIDWKWFDRLDVFIDDAKSVAASALTQREGDVDPAAIRSARSTAAITDRVRELEAENARLRSAEENRVAAGTAP